MQIIIRCVVGVLAAVGFLAFAIPMSANILNVGNITGMLLCALILLYTIFFKGFNRLIVHFWEYAAGKVVLIAMGILAAIAVVLMIMITVCMVSASVRQPQEAATVVVLGCKVNGESPSLMLRERLDAAVEYLQEHPDAACVVSGGQGNGEAISEAECMKRYLVNNGIAEERIYKEDKSTSTRENLGFSKDVIEQNRLEPTIAIVTNEFHQYRAAQIAGSINMTAYAVSAPTASWLFPTYYFREAFAILYEWVF